MASFIYVFSYLCVLICLFFVVTKVISYVKKPLHVRWELYPVAHEGARASYGGSYLEDTDWWEKKPHVSLISELKAMALEIFFMHCTFEHKRDLWYRTYPFHIGLYFVIVAAAGTGLGAFGIVFGALGTGGFWMFLEQVVNYLTAIGFSALLIGSVGLFLRRLSDKGLRKYSTMEHFFNLALFAAFAAFGLLVWLSTPSFYVLGRDFFANMLQLNFVALDNLFFSVYLILGFFAVAYIPAGFMGHVFMKYFLYHDIRWGDKPSYNNKKIQESFMSNLGKPVDWKADHIKGDGKKTWAEVATTNPTKTDEDK